MSHDNHHQSNDKNYNKRNREQVIILGRSHSTNIESEYQQEQFLLSPHASVEHHIEHPGHPLQQQGYNRLQDSSPQKSFLSDNLYQAFRLSSVNNVNDVQFETRNNNGGHDMDYDGSSPSASKVHNHQGLMLMSPTSYQNPNKNNIMDTSQPPSPTLTFNTTLTNISNFKSTEKIKITKKTAKNKKNHKLLDRNNQQTSTKYLCCGRWVITMTKRKWVVQMMILILILIAIILGTTLPLLGKNPSLSGSTNNNDSNLNPSFLYVGDHSGKIYQFDIINSKNPKFIQAFKGHSNYICSGHCFHMENSKSRYFSASGDGTVQVWPIQKQPSSSTATTNQTSLTTYTIPYSSQINNGNRIMFFSIIVYKERLFIGTNTSSVYEMNIANDKQIVRNFTTVLSRGTFDMTNSIEYSPKFNLLYAATETNGLFVWNASNGDPIASVSTPTLTQVTVLLLLEDMNMIIVASPSMSNTIPSPSSSISQTPPPISYNSSIGIVDISSGRVPEITTQYYLRTSTTSLAYHPTQNVIYIGGASNGSIIRIDLTKNTTLAPLNFHKERVWALWIVGTELFSCGDDNLVLNWDLQSFQVKYQFNLKEFDQSVTGCGALGVV